VAAKALREMMDAYLCLRMRAGEVPAPDDVSGALARRLYILETAGILSREIEPIFRQDIRLDEPPPLLRSEPGNKKAGAVPALAEVHVPQKLDLDCLNDPPAQTEPLSADLPAKTGAGGEAALDSPARIAVSLPQHEIDERLNEAADHLRHGRADLARVEESPGPNTSLLLATKAKEKFEHARNTLTELRDELVRSQADAPTLARVEESLGEAQYWFRLSRSLFSEQKSRLLPPRTAKAAGELSKKKNAVVLGRPSNFVRTLGSIDEATKKPGKLIHLEVNIQATESMNGVAKTHVVQKLVLHCHIDPRCKVETPADLTKIEDSHIREAHLKPAFFVMMTQRYAPKMVTATGAQTTINVPYCPVTHHTARYWMKLAAALP
jgi:hypothetical protein